MSHIRAKETSPKGVWRIAPFASPPSPPSSRASHKNVLAFVGVPSPPCADKAAFQSAICNLGGASGMDNRGFWGSLGADRAKGSAIGPILLGPAQALLSTIRRTPPLPDRKNLLRGGAALVGFFFSSTRTSSVYALGARLWELDSPQEVEQAKNLAGGLRLFFLSLLFAAVCLE